MSITIPAVIFGVCVLVGLLIGDAFISLIGGSAWTAERNLTALIYCVGGFITGRVSK